MVQAAEVAAHFQGGAHGCAVALLEARRFGDLPVDSSGVSMAPLGLQGLGVLA